MQIAMIGLGRMGANMVRRLMDGGHDCVVHDVAEQPIVELEAAGASGARTLEAMIAALERPRHVWIMVPAAFVGSTVDRLAPLMEPDDTIIDGGNSWYRDDVDRSERMRAGFGVNYLDVGTSGGIHGLERGYCLMVGGDDTAVQRLEPFFGSLAPGVDAADRTPGREGEPTPAEQGWLHCGPSGAGHFVKMVHNGIEYGMMAAFAEGLNILHNADIGGAEHEIDAETTPLREPELYQYEFDIGEIAEVWRRGSVVGSWLLDLTAAALAQSPALENFSGRVSDSGEGRWTAHAAIDEGVPAPVLTAALFSRFASRDEDEFANKVLSAMRFAFGGHLEKSHT
jgi:6-phosphogluconate dehydrogenase